MSSAKPSRAVALRFVAGALGCGLLVYLVFRIGPAALIEQARAVRWRMCLILALGGLAHLIKAYAWSCIFPKGLRIPLGRSLKLRLISEAAAQLGLPGQVLGEGLRVSLLGQTVPLSMRISSATIDRGLYTISAALVGVMGVFGAILLLPLSRAWRQYSAIIALAMLVFLVITVVAVLRRWPVLSASVSALRRLNGFKEKLSSAEHTIRSAEEVLFEFHRQRPAAFWTSFALNVASQLFAILEVYLLLHFTGNKIGFLGTVVYEGFTKVINTVGALVPGNVGTYEGGNILIGRFFRVTSAAALTISMCRRIRGLFWAAVGMCFLPQMTRAKSQRNIAYMNV